MARYPAPDDRELRRFLTALASVESGGRYDARNAESGARGRYQILPSNWPAWAAQYLGKRDADPWLPANQDRVATGKITDLYRWLGSWDRVAAWWLAGGAVATGDPDAWSPTVRAYVRGVMTRFERYGGSADPLPQPIDPARPVAAATPDPFAQGCAQFLGGIGTRALAVALILAAAS